MRVGKYGKITTSNENMSRINHILKEKNNRRPGAGKIEKYAFFPRTITDAENIESFLVKKNSYLFTLV